MHESIGYPHSCGEITKLAQPFLIENQRFSQTRKCEGCGDESLLDVQVLSALEVATVKIARMLKEESP